MAQRLLDVTPEKRYAAADWALSVLVMHGVISAYGDSGSQALQSTIMLGKYPAANLGVARNVSLCGALGAAVPYAVASLEELSSISSLGLMHYPTRAWSGWQQPERPDARLNLMVRFFPCYPLVLCA